MSSPELTVLGLCGSLRPGSLTLKALETVLAAAQGTGARTEILSGERMRLPLCDGRPPGEAPPEVAALFRQVEEAGALVLATPDYCGSLSGALKNALDWLAPNGLAGKAVGVVSVAGGASAEGSLTALREICLRQAAWVVPVPAAVPLSNEVFGNPEAPFARTLLDLLQSLGRALPEAARLLAGWETVVGDVRYRV